jgi:sarcosine oxidase
MNSRRDAGAVHAAPASKSDQVSDLLVIGGGVMGLFTAYHASERFGRVVVLERGRVGDPMTASYGRTRSFRNDYLDATYARLAHEAFRLWGDFEARTATDVLVRCGCLNIAKGSVTPNLADTYAQLSYETLTRLGLSTESLDGPALRRRFSYLDADMARLDVDAGVVDVPAVTRSLTRVLGEREVQTFEGVETTSIVRDGASMRVITDAGEFATRSLVVTAGHGTNDILAKLPGCGLRVPISKDRPSDAKYFVPPAHARDRFTAGAMPVIAYLDAGIYCHPIVDGLVDAVKIGYYNPPDMPRGTAAIDSIASFVEQCMPGLKDATIRDVEDVDQCHYDLVADDDFVLGAIPGFTNAFVGVGWRGTGYKFAPWVGRVLAELALQDGTVYDIDRFDPARFEQGNATDDPSVAEDPAAASV